MTVLVTGHEGFIGRNLIKNFHDVIGIDAKSSNIETELYAVNWRSIKQIYHLGAITDTTVRDWEKIYKHNVWFSIELFERAIANDIPIVYASSSAVYGNTIESGKYLVNPLNYYAMSKAMIDMWFLTNLNRFRNGSKGFRLYNVYGDDEQKNFNSTSAVSKFIEQGKNRGIISLFKHSHEVNRDFIHVDDVIQAFQYSMHHTRAHIPKGIYDLGTGKTVNLLGLAQDIAEKTYSTIKYIDMPPQLINSYQYYTKAKPDYNIYGNFGEYSQVRDYINDMFTD
jgi:ADP-L-glycero-D-manno-heptose 6-epimerase